MTIAALPVLFLAAAALAEEAKQYTITPGTRIPLSMINSVSTKHAAEGDRIYLESVFPILVDGRIIYRSYSDREGRIHYVTEIRANYLVDLDR